MTAHLLQHAWVDGRVRDAVLVEIDDGRFTRVRAEREFLRLLEGGCSTPVGVHTRLEEGILHMAARVFPDEGGEPRTAGASGVDPLETARQLFDSLA